MKMLEAFKRLLDGEKITRPAWDGKAYIEYDSNNNAFVLQFRLGDTDICRDPYFGKNGISYIYFIGDDNNGQLSLFDDDQNEIYVSEEEKIELDAMRWRVHRYCKKNTCNTICKLHNQVKGCECNPQKDLELVSPEEVKHLYGLIKEDN